jgi:uncharacterized membrane protein
MALLLLGLVAFFGVHSLRVWGESWRSRRVAAMGPGAWKLAYSAVSIAGLALLVWGYAQARVGSPMLWTPPAGLRVVTAVLVLVAFVLFASSGVNGHLKAKMGHPMTLGVKTWSAAHLFSNGSLADVLLFGSFLAWSVLVFSAARRRDRAAGTGAGGGSGPAASWGADALAAAIGAAAWFAFARWGHQWLIGVSPMG